MSINNSINLSEEQIKDAPSGAISLNSKKPSKPVVVNTDEADFPLPSSAPRISERTQKVSRPNISGSGAYVSRPNVERHLEAHEARKKAEALAKEEYVSPAQAQEAQIQYLTRAVKSLQKELKALKNNV